MHVDAFWLTDGTVLRQTYPRAWKLFLHTYFALSGKRNQLDFLVTSKTYWQVVLSDNQKGFFFINIDKYVYQKHVYVYGSKVKWD